MPVKPAILHPLARQVIREFPAEIRRVLGKAIYDLQFGRLIGMPLSRPMPVVAPGVSELRVKDSSGAYRVFYYMKYADAIFVFHAFVKKTQSTPEREIRIARRRLKELL